MDVKFFFREYERPETELPPIGNVHQWESKRREACDYFGGLLKNPDKLTENDISDLLNFYKNQTMEARRVISRLVENIEAFKKGVRILTDEERDIKERLNEVLAEVPGMGRAIATMILFLYDPQKYPFWSHPKEKVLKKIGVIDELTGTPGDKYLKIIDAEKKLCSELGIKDFVKLDTFLWWIFKKEIQRAEEVETEAVPFEAEAELRDFLCKHPEAIERGLSLEEGGVEYQTDVGRIDLLCRDENGHFVVVELKKTEASDKALGQLLRYMGWIKEKKAGGKKVRGILITHEFDENLDYALKTVPDVKVKYYAIRFELDDTPFEI
ncbi:MAG: endonuclease NucS [Candidatus Hadarchaeales archaeon]